MRFSLSFLILFVVVPLMGIELANHGKSSYAIYFEQEPSALEKLAANELKSYFKKSTGANLEIRSGTVSGPAILLRRDSGLDNDESSVAIQGKNLVLSGGDEWGVLYSVYAFLENQLGIRWYTAYGDEKVPNHVKLSLGFKPYREKPAFTRRSGMNYYYYQMPDSNMFFLRNRMNGMRNLANPRYPGSKTKYMAVGDQGHTFFYYIPVRKGHYPQNMKFKTEKYYFSEHPEYFSMDKKGKRVTNLQLCFSNPALRKEFTRRFLECVGLMGKEGIYSISAMDWPGSFCYCPECQKLEAKYRCKAGPMLDYLIELCALAAKKYPKVYISTLAYRKKQSEKPPVMTQRLPDNLIILFAPIDDDFSKTFQHKHNAGTYENIRNWKKLAKNIDLWYYPLPYGERLPIAGIERAATDTRLLWEAGVNGVMYEHDVGVFKGLNFGDLITWVLLKLFQDPCLDWKPLVREFCDYYYGKAAPEMISYMEELEKYAREYQQFQVWDAGPVRTAFTPENLTRWNRLFDRMEQTVASDKRQLANVRDVRISLDIAILFSWQAVNKKYPGVLPPPETLKKRALTNLDSSLSRRFPPKKTAAIASRRRKVVQLLEKAMLYASANPKPLPPPFDKIPQEKIRQTFPVKLPRVSVVNDPDSAFGYAICDPKKPLEMPFSCGVYDKTGAKFVLSRSIGSGEIVPDQYHFYKIGNVAFTPSGVLWTKSNWCCFFNLDDFFIPGEDPNKKYEVWLSVKFEGPGYSAKSKAKANRALLDRVIVIEK